MPKPLQEQAKLTESVDRKSGKILVDIVTPGVGSSGYYSPEVCEAAAGLVTAGTQMFIDHPTDAEAMERPIRSVKDIAAVFTESARWDPTRGDAGSLVAEAQVVPAWVETMGVIQGAIGVSLRGSATDIVEGEVDGRRMPVVEGLHSIDSVDFVTRAGRGGAFSLLESAGPSKVNARAVGHGVSEATVNDTREALQTALRDLYGAEKTYVWVRDFDDTTVWFEIEAPDEESGVYGQTYTQSEAGAVALAGDRTEVRVATSYVPVARPGSTTTATESEEDTMPKIQVEESVHTDALAKAGRVDAVESENTALKAENTTLKEAAAKRDRTDRARVIITERATEAGVAFDPLQERGLLAELPLKEGALDEEAFTAAVDEAAKKIAAAGTPGSGLVGFGASADSTDVEESAPTMTPWGRPLTVKGA